MDGWGGEKSESEGQAQRGWGGAGQGGGRAGLGAVRWVGWGRSKSESSLMSNSPIPVRSEKSRRLGGPDGVGGDAQALGERRVDYKSECPPSGDKRSVTHVYLALFLRVIGSRL